MPTGEVTFLFSDIEGSTQRWDAYAEAMKSAVFMCAPSEVSPTSNGTPELGEEMTDEHQALLAAHKADRSFVTIEEWTAKADRRKGVTVLGKDPVVRH